MVTYQCDRNGCGKTIEVKHGEPPKPWTWLKIGSPNQSLVCSSDCREAVLREHLSLLETLPWWSPCLGQVPRSDSTVGYQMAWYVGNGKAVVYKSVVGNVGLAVVPAEFFPGQFSDEQLAALPSRGQAQDFYQKSTTVFPADSPTGRLIELSLRLKTWRNQPGQGKPAYTEVLDWLHRLGEVCTVEAIEPIFDADQWRNLVGNLDRLCGYMPSFHPNQDEKVVAFILELYRRFYLATANDTSAYRYRKMRVSDSHHLFEISTREVRQGLRWQNNNEWRQLERSVQNLY